jgi:Fe-S cluster assembly protein SufD
MSTVLEQIAAFTPASVPDYLMPVRASGRAALAGATWPDRKTEAWKYTSLRLIEQGGFFANNEASVVDLDSAVARALCEIPNLNGHRLVFVNGQFDASLSHTTDLPDGVELVTFADASAQQQKIIQQHLNSVVDLEQHLFAALNNQLIDGGVFLHLRKNVEVAQPLHIVWLSASAGQAVQVAQRLLAVLDDNSSASLIEHFASTGAAQNSLTHGISELVLGAGARCQHYRLHLEQTLALHVGGFHASLARNAQLNSFHLALGSALKRIDLVINHNGEGAHCDLNGLYLPGQDEHVDYHTCIEHRAPRCTTVENFRGVVAANGRAVFNGRIHIHRDAQKTSAQLSNKNLLTSNKAEVDTKPELEIYADDVQCAHGATVAQLDEGALHYFRTRGIAQKEAEVMLSFGFVNELINDIQHPAIAAYLRPKLAKLFARDASLTELL